MKPNQYFDTVAQLYESARPGYPSLLVDDLLILSGVPPGGCILDVGCGTGKSTEPFVKKGFSVCALDPGANLLALCAKKLQGFPNVTFENTTFEAWSASGRVFDLVISGTAFHWVSDEGHEQILRVLKPRGGVGIFWHTYLNGRGTFYEQLNKVYKDHAPELYAEDLEATQELADRRQEERIMSWTEFTDWRAIRYYDTVCYSSARYVDLLRTWSTHANLSESFFRAVSCLIEDAGGEIEKPIRTTLCFGRRITEHA